MNKIKSTTTFFVHLGLSLSIAAVAFVADAAAQSEPVGPTKPVVVVNTPNQPVPVTGTVGITGPVAITGAVGITPGNDPLLVRDADRQAREPFQRSFSLSGGSTSANFSVPAGKRLFMEFASMNSSVVTGCRVVTFGIGTTVGGNSGSFTLAPTHISGTELSSGRSFDTVGQQVRISADPGTMVNLSLFTQTSSPGCALLGGFSVSGYLVDVP